MTSFVWTDATSYSQGESGKAPQTAWEIKINGHRVWLSCGHRYFPGQWVMNCAAFDIKEFRVGYIADMGIDDAKTRAVYLVAKKAQRLIDDAQATIHEIAKAKGETP